MPILALTANVMAAERENYLRAGMDLCLTKPVVWPDLFAALARVAADQDTAAPAAAPLEVAPMTEPEADHRKVPLLDQGLLTGMAQALPAAAYDKLMDRGLESARDGCRRLIGALGQQDQLMQEAHRLRGTSGSFGLARISALAGEVENRAAQRLDVATLLVELEELVDLTRIEISRADRGAGPGVDTENA